MMRAQERVAKTSRGPMIGVGCTIIVVMLSCTPAPRTVSQRDGATMVRPHRSGLFDSGASRTRVQTGYCSYMGKEEGGGRMANGGFYDPYEMTAAHRNLPFGTVVRVTNTKNGRSVRVVIADRGPFRRPGRVIDVSYGAAYRLGMIADGVVPVTIEVIGDMRDPNVLPDERLVDSPARSSEWWGRAVQGFERLVDWVLEKN